MVGTTKAKAEDVSAMATLHMARQYHEAADELFAVNERRKGTVDQYKIDDPVYLLYFQTVELALKAFLRSHGLPIAGTNRKGHNLKALMRSAKRSGWLGADDRLTITTSLACWCRGTWTTDPPLPKSTSLPTCRDS
jgi:hypothetical protein